MDIWKSNYGSDSDGGGGGGSESIGSILIVLEMAW
jgi:hypothetical protein